MGLLLALSFCLFFFPGAGSPAEDLPFDRLTDDPAVDAMPSWSPDGRRIVFHSRRAAEKEGALPTRKIWVTDARGGNARKISDGAADEYHAVFSPDGRKIAFVSEAAGSRDIWLMDASGENPIPLTDDPGLEEHPCWSPDGRHIAYAALPKEGGNFDLWMMNADGSARRKLTFTAANEIFPAWHPDGKTLAFTTDASGNFGIHGLDLADERAFPILDGPDHESRPAWSPDGTRIAFARWPADEPGQRSALWVANADGSVPTELPIPRPATHPAWSPDGTRLAFQRRDGANWDVGSTRLPNEIVKGGRLLLAHQVRGRANEDVVRLRGGEAIYGSIRNGELRLRASYGDLAFPSRIVASLQFAGLETGTAKIVLANGDFFTGLPGDDEIVVESARGKQSVRREKIEAVGFRERPAPEGKGRARLVMKNGDSFTGTLRTRALRLAVGSQTVEVPVADLARVEFADEGKKSRLVTRKGDTLSGVLETPLLELDLALGRFLGLYPPHIRTLTFAEPAS